MNFPALQDLHHGKTGTEQSPQVANDCFEYRFRIGHRSADRRKNFAGGGLLFERLGQFAGALAQLVEQAGVLDGDRRLIGERLEQRDVLVLERPHLAAAHQDRAERAALAQQRHRHRGSVAKSLRKLTAKGEIVIRAKKISDVNGLLIDDRAAHHTIAVNTACSSVGIRPNSPNTAA